jgi:hypothetical protein
MFVGSKDDARYVADSCGATAVGAGSSMAEETGIDTGLLLAGGDIRV